MPSESHWGVRRAFSETGVGARGDAERASAIAWGSGRSLSKDFGSPFATSTCQQGAQKQCSGIPGDCRPGTRSCSISFGGRDTYGSFGRDGIHFERQTSADRRAAPEEACSEPKQGPLSESEEEEDVEVEEEGLPSGGSGEQDGAGPQRSMERAIVKLTAIAAKLAGPKEKHKIDSLLDGGSGGVGGSESSSIGAGRKNAAAMRALQKCLLEDPKYIFQIMEANLQSDFLSRPIQPGEPLASGTTVRGWLTARSRIQLYHNHVRWAWQFGGIWDCLIAGRHEEARARCALLIGAADQASIDGGNWVVSNVALLEAPPPYQSFATHQSPSPLELQHSVLYDHRWGGDISGASQGGGLICGRQEETWLREGCPERSSRDRDRSAQSQAEGEVKREGRQRSKGAREFLARSGGSNHA